MAVSPETSNIQISLNNSAVHLGIAFGSLIGGVVIDLASVEQNRYGWWIIHDCRSMYFFDFINGKKEKKSADLVMFQGSEPRYSKALPYWWGSDPKNGLDNRGVPVTQI